jgi:hypothetical protein
MSDVGHCWQARRSKTLKKLPLSQLLYCKSSLVSALFSVAFGHRDLQILPSQTSFCRDFSKKEFIRTTHEAWKNWNNIEQTVANTDPETPRKVAQKHTKTVDDCFREGGGHFQLSSRRWWTFSASAVKLFCKLFLTNKNWKKNSLVFWYLCHQSLQTVVVRVAF